MSPVVVLFYRVLAFSERKAFHVKDALDEAVEIIFLFKFYCLDPCVHIVLVDHTMKREVGRSSFALF